MDSMTGPLDRADLATIQSALLFVRDAIATRGENPAAFDRALQACAAALSPTASVCGSPPETPRHTEYVSTTEAAKLLNTSERWARDLAPRIGGIKQAGRWLIPKDALPQEDQ